MAHIQLVDELVKEYLLFRGFTATVKSFDNDLKADKDKGFRVDKMVDQIMQYINSSDLSGLKEYWAHLENFVFSKLQIHFQPAIRKMEYSLYKLYLVIAVQGSGGVKNENVTEFFSKMLPELQGQSEWKDWFMLPYIQKPEENLAFSVYFTKSWQDTVLVSLHNLLSTVFQCMPQPTLTNYETDAALVKKLQEELTFTKSQNRAQYQMNDKLSPNTVNQSRQQDRLTGPVPLVDDFNVIPSENLDNGVREAKGLRGLIRQMGGSPVLVKKTGKS